MIGIDCAFDGGDWPEEAICQDIANKAVAAAESRIKDRVPDEAEVSLLFTDDKHMKSLNAQWRQQDKPTNVLSFAANEGGGPVTPVLGDIVLACETITREAQEQEKTFNDHLAHLIIHGFLHLVGFDHVAENEAQTMEQLEREICASLGIADPYEAH